MTARHVPRRSWLGHLVRGTLGRIAAALFRTTLIGTENIPRDGGVILAGNHVSYADPILLWSRGPRTAHFMAKIELWDLWGGFMGWALDHFWAFPVRRGAADREAISEATEYLRAGEAVGMFPEGTRIRGGESEAHGGVAFLALRAGVPVVPVGVAGTGEIMPDGSRMPHFPKVVISYGEPVRPDDVAGEGRRERTEAMTSAIMTRIAEERDRAEARRK